METTTTARHAPEGAFRINAHLAPKALAFWARMACRPCDYSGRKTPEEEAQSGQLAALIEQGIALLGPAQQCEKIVEWAELVRDLAYQFEGEICPSSSCWEEEGGAVLRWVGTGTLGRWVEVRVLPSRAVQLYWDTATGKESNFFSGMGLDELLEGGVPLL